MKSKLILYKISIKFNQLFLPSVLPSPPVLPEAVDWTKESVSLSWQQPKDCGRGKIFGYLVEFTKAGEEWQKVNQTPDSCQGTKFKVINLEEGEYYRFRVTAVNFAGESEPAYTTDPVKAEDRFGKIILHLCS